MADTECEKTQSLIQTIFGPECRDCTIKMEMRYSSILFDHISVVPFSYMAGF